MIAEKKDPLTEQFEKNMDEADRRIIDKLAELAVLEAAARGFTKAKIGRLFDREIFEAVAETELKKLRAAFDAGVRWKSMSDNRARPGHK
jgi:hypothetical protein